MTRPPNIPTVAEALALVRAAELLDAKFPHRLDSVVSAARTALDTAQDFDKRGALPVTVGSEIRYRDSQGRASVGRVAKIGRKWVTLENDHRLSIAEGRGDNPCGYTEQASPTDAWRLSRLQTKETT